jgi:hydroxymethylglutaryl-CoA reductase (NADPH)
VAFLDLELHNEGLLAKITFPNLVVGTVGGGTHLPKQSEALELMGCKGNGKSSRLASLIAGFALGLELSTYSAIVSGEFAKAHEKLGRNRPVEWLTRNEVNKSFLLSFLKHPQKEKIVEISMEDSPFTENGILTHIAARVTKKMIGFEEILLKFDSNINQINGLITNKKGSPNALIEERILLKSKATDTEVIKGLHLISASIDSMLSDSISQHRETLEYKNSHLKEALIYEFLDTEGYSFIPNYYGSYRNDEREVHIVCLEFLNEQDMFIFNSENHPEHWNRNAIQWAISDIGLAHRVLKKVQSNSFKDSDIIQEFKPWVNNQLYNKIIQILMDQNEEKVELTMDFKPFVDASLRLKDWGKELNLIPKTVIHNDFNSRNVGVRLNGDVVIYDWELSVINFPHRDIVEFLSFTLDIEKNAADWLSYLEFHFQDSKGLWKDLTANDFLEFRRQWFYTYEYSLTELIVTRLIFYEVAGIVVKYEFSNRVLQTANWLLSKVHDYNQNNFIQ